MNGQRQMNTTSSRILTDVPCKVCHDNSSGKHYGIFACDGCAGFFKRSIRRNRQYACKNHGIGNCPIDKTHRNQCRSCRLRRCLESGMNKEAVQHERGPRNSTIKKQMALLLKESTDLMHAYQFHRYQSSIPFQNPQSVPKHPTIDHHELAAKILFNAINWIKTVPAFTSLSNRDQLCLLEESWRDLFILTAVEQQYTLDVEELIYSNHQYEMFRADIENFQEILNKLKQMKMDPNELICLKNFVLFKANLNDCQTIINPQLNDLHSINYLHNQAHILLSTYINKQYPCEENRCLKLLTLISSFRLISSSIIEEVFFRKTIGDKTHMEQLVKDMYRMVAINS
ncbi:unnamed protein product [Rotaria magnacalcarata]|uniref:Uncharacterized protein n=2 Tax=Rotaria magnacalcarata TaxID=392030 RepID=A0A815Z692_9BILA|nr:unnamed protein product [Rotaria magnacalcarata]CAF2067073.1 unnamed protein product [Rotaria magnacalcarata]CAF2230748.1 unnamed protein product [Rotaria magnacalcarata]